MAKFRPINNQVLVKREDEKEKEGSLFIPQNAQEKSTRGTVVSVGPGQANEYGVFVKTTLAPGNKVVFGKYSGVDMEIDGEKHLVIREPDILLCMIED